MENNSYSFLILGKPASGKTSFKAQLFIRLEDGEGTDIKMNNRPDTIAAIKDDIERTRAGLAVNRTASAVNIETELSLIFSDGTQAEIPYYDYAGEKIDNILKNRIVENHWAKKLRAKDAWVLFIKLSDLTPNDNIYTRPREMEAKTDEDATFELTDSAYYIELLQILLFIKGKGLLKPLQRPVLQIVLSCYDEIDFKEGDAPREKLREVLPLFVEFVESIWEEKSLSFLGLSATEKKLDLVEYDEEIIDRGAEDIGYVILPNGKESKDLTQVIANLVKML